MKQVIIVRKNVKMGKGKICSQVAHASLHAYKIALRKFSKKVKQWEVEGEKKIVLKANEDELLKIYQECLKLGLPVALIKDAGLTQIKPGTITALGIGPYDEYILDKLVGDLKLY